MAETNGKIEKQGELSEKTLRKMFKFQKTANDAVQKAQEENRRLGIPNWYSIGGVIVSDIQIKEINKKGLINSMAVLEIRGRRRLEFLEKQTETHRQLSGREWQYFSSYSGLVNLMY